MTREQALDAWAAMTPEERLAMAETAPMVAEAWVDRELWSSRQCALLDTSAAWTNMGEVGKAREDERLIEEGWILK